MKKYFCSFLLFFLMTYLWSNSHLIASRIGDFGCITRLVFELSDKMDYSLSTDDRDLLINFSNLNAEHLNHFTQESDNLLDIDIAQSSTSTNLTFNFSYPIEVEKNNYYNEDKKYMVVIDVYDVGYKTDKEKALATLLFKAQKFPLPLISKEIVKFSKRYSQDSLVNLYFGKLFAYKKNKQKAIEFFSKIPPSAEQFSDAQSIIYDLHKNKFPHEEVKPLFLYKNIEIVTDTLITDNEDNLISDSLVYDSLEVVVQDVREREDLIVTDSIITISPQKDDSASSTKKIIVIISIIYFIISLALIIFLAILNRIKKDKITKLNALLKLLNEQLKSLDTKLRDDVLANSKTKEKMIIKLFNSGWKPEDIAQELNTSLDIVETTISKEVRL